MTRSVTVRLDDDMAEVMSEVCDSEGIGFTDYIKRAIRTFQSMDETNRFVWGFSALSAEDRRMVSDLMDRLNRRE